LLDISLALDREVLELPKGSLKAIDIMSGEAVDIGQPVVLHMPSRDEMKHLIEYGSEKIPFMGRLIWIREKQ
jgi:hypothetical protein